MNDDGIHKASGLVIRAAHFPGRAPIDAYGNGGFRFADKSHRGSILCLQSGIYGWTPAVPADLSVATFQRVLDEADLELLLVGTGLDLVPLGKDLHEAFAAKNIRAEVMNTGAAARTFNVLLAENRAVGAALLAVE